jgi:hypothetical protein
MLAHIANLAPLALLLLVGCSGASSPPGGSPEASPHDAATSSDAPIADGGSRVEASGGESGDGPKGGDAATEAEAAFDAASTLDSSGAGSGPCASCTATQCLTELEACAASTACTNGLVAFNSCFTSPSLGASCGATFATQGTEAAALWACISSMCMATCD